MKYNIILADPPWAYKDKRNNDSAYGAMTYQTMPLDEIKALPVKDIADTNCMLFLWATFPNLQPALDVIKAWGFTYKTVAFSWVKTNKKNGKPFFGCGFYTKANAEVCLLGVKGKPIKVSNKVSSIVITPREEHSKKPDVVRERIVELCGDIPRIELFARQQTPGWDVYGNEVANSIKFNIRSDCCNSPVMVGGEGLTHYYVCGQCYEPCDVKNASIVCK